MRHICKGKLSKIKMAHHQYHHVDTGDGACVHTQPSWLHSNWQHRDGIAPHSVLPGVEPNMQMQMHAFGETQRTAPLLVQWLTPELVCTAICIAVFLLVLLVVPDFWTPDTTPSGELIDAASRLFPVCDRSWQTAPPLAQKELGGAARVLDRPDIRSFGFDLGGSSCACTLQWDSEQYWQRVFYGVKYVQPHVLTAYLGIIMSHRWQWVLLYKFLNEILEELAVGVTGRWALVDSFANIEPRYDSLINDCLLAALPFCALGCHMVFALALPDPLEGPPLQYDSASAYRLCVTFSQYYLLNNVNNFFRKFAHESVELHPFGVACDIGKACTCALQTLALLLVWRMRAWPVDKFCKTAVGLLLLWIPFVFYPLHVPHNEQIAALLAFALSGFYCSWRHFRCCCTASFGVLFWLPLCVYTTSLCLYLQLVYSTSPFITPPSDTFYHNWKACGISAQHSRQQSCDAIVY